MESVELLEAAHKLISDPTRWCKDALTNGKGAYCIEGALGYVGGMYLLRPWWEPSSVHHNHNAYQAWKALVDACGSLKPWEVNDHNGHEAALAAYERAIRSLK